MATLKWLKSGGNYYYFNDAPVHISSITLNKDSISLNSAGQTEQLTATITPDDAVEKKVHWSSSDLTVATVDQTGLVTCVTPGSCTITAECDGVSAMCSIQKTIYIDYIVVGGGATGGIGESAGGSGGGGGGGEVLFGAKNALDVTSISVVVGQGGQKANGCCAGGDTCFGDMVAKGGCFSVLRKVGSAYLYRSGGTSGSGCLGWQRTDNYTGSGGGGGGAGGEGCEPPSPNLGGAGGAGICGYGGGGGGAGYNRGAAGGAGIDGGGNGNGGDATNYGGGGGGGMCGARGGTGCQGAVILCYKTGDVCATGGTVTTSGDYTIHTFTSDGTFCIIS